MCAVECFGDFLLLACASFLNEYNFTVMYMLGKANKEQFGLGTGSQKLTSFCSSPLHQHELRSTCSCLRWLCSAHGAMEQAAER